MSFETLIWLLLTVLFVVAPMFSSKNRKKPDGQAGDKPPAGRPEGGPGQPTALESRLEEARRRIEAATQEQQASTAAPPAPRQASSSVSQPQPRKLVTSTLSKTISGKPLVAQGQQQQSRPALDWQQAGIDWQAPPRKYTSASHAAAKAAAERNRRLKADSTELQVTRLDRPTTYTGRRRRVEASALFGQQNVLSGYIWHQILSEPPHRRGARRRVSRLRSP